jgi:hypothetical protein
VAEHRQARADRGMCGWHPTYLRHANGRRQDQNRADPQFGRETPREMKAGPIRKRSSPTRPSEGPNLWSRARSQVSWRGEPSGESGLAPWRGSRTGSGGGPACPRLQAHCATGQSARIPADPSNVRAGSGPGPCPRRIRRSERGPFMFLLRVPESGTADLPRLPGSRALLLSASKTGPGEG